MILLPFLVVDDDEGSGTLIQMLLEKAAVRNVIKTFRDGEDVVEYLTLFIGGGR